MSDAVPGASSARPASRRQRYRAETLAEIKALALDQLRRGGIGALSLNAVAHEMGMTGPALYRYVASRDDLLTLLITDAYESLGAALETAASQGGSAHTIYGRVLRTYRRWALDHATEFGLIFGNPIPGYAAPEGGPTVSANLRVMQALTDAYAAAWRAAGSSPSPSVAPGRPLATQLRRTAGTLAPDLPAEAVAAMVGAWTRVHGLVMLELFGHLRFAVGDTDAFAELEVAALLAEVTPAR